MLCLNNMNEIDKLKEGDKILLLVPFKMHVNRNVKEELNILLQKGFSRLYCNNEIIRIEDLLADKAVDVFFSKNKKEKYKPYIVICIDLSNTTISIVLYLDIYSFSNNTFYIYTTSIML